MDPVAPNPENIHSLNRYAYANNNPYKFVDPDGRDPKDLQSDGDDNNLADEAFENIETISPATFSHNIEGIKIFDIPPAFGGRNTGSTVKIDVDALSKFAAEFYKNGRTRAGFSLDKHSQRQGSIYSSSSRKPAVQNEEAQDIIDDILTTPGTQFINKTARKDGVSVPVLDAISPDGRAFRFDASINNLSGFREPW